MCSVIWAEDAAALTSREVRENMSPDQLAGYMAGVVDGLATARWLADQPDAGGMRCIYDWYLQQPNDGVWNTVMDWLERHPDQQVGALMHVLIERECPTE